MMVICSYDSAARRLGRSLRRGGGGSSGVLHHSASHATAGWDGYASEASGYSAADSYRPGFSGAPSAAASDFDYAFEQGYHYAGSADARGPGGNRRRLAAGSSAGRHWEPEAAAGGFPLCQRRRNAGAAAAACWRRWRCGRWRLCGCGGGRGARRRGNGRKSPPRQPPRERRGIACAPPRQRCNMAVECLL